MLPVSAALFAECFRERLVRTPFLRRRTGLRRWLRISISSSSQTPTLVRKTPSDDVYGYLQGWKYRATNGWPRRYRELQFDTELPAVEVERIDVGS